MKFMGSKLTMLQNGLGHIVVREASKAKRFIDLFAGSGVVAWYAAEHTSAEVHAYDLQEFAVALSRAVVGRTSALSVEPLWEEWRKRAADRLNTHLCRAAGEFEHIKWSAKPRANVIAARELCTNGPTTSITAAYGGYYFSPKQALSFDALRDTLPSESPARDVALAALIMAASKCAASPGHTAQPFQPTRKAAPHIWDAWSKHPSTLTYRALIGLCARHATTLGQAEVQNALDTAATLRSGDVAFIDPPYSAVQYSRFYHVLEAIVIGASQDISGAGRYPPASARPTSDFSLVSKSQGALKELLGTLAKNGVPAVLTFPKEETSNGLSGDTVTSVGREYFRIKRHEVNGRFSTLGGGPTNRGARVPAYEIILVMQPK